MNFAESEKSKQLNISTRDAFNAIQSHSEFSFMSKLAVSHQL